VSALQDSNHSTFTPPLDSSGRRVARYPRYDAVAVHGRADIFRRNENVGFAGFLRREKAIACRMNR
jgi:hypothetical protein